MTKELLASWQDIHILSKRLSKHLKESGKKWDRVVAVTRGGMVPACLVAYDLDIRKVDAICVKSYDFQTQSEIEIISAPDNLGTGQGCLVIDDLSDSGKTFDFLRGMLPDASFACLYVKPEGRKHTDFYIEETTQDTWIFVPWEENDYDPDVRDRIVPYLISEDS